MPAKLKRPLKAKRAKAAAKPTPAPAPKRPLRDRKKHARPARVSRPKAGAKIGRPTKLTPECQAVIEAAIEKGMSCSAAGRLAGLNPQTISDWRTRFPDFSDAIEAARARGLQKRLQTIDNGVNAGGFKDWRAAAWLIERTHPEEFGKKAADIHLSAHASAGASSGSGLVLSDADVQALQERRLAAQMKRQEAKKGSQISDSKAQSAKG